ncbi:hypothetical protein Dimus_019972, partial [Dionaea muscipula]
ASACAGLRPWITAAAPDGSRSCWAELLLNVGWFKLGCWREMLLLHHGLLCCIMGFFFLDRCVRCNRTQAGTRRLLQRYTMAAA